MRVLLSSLLAATALLTPVLPAFASVTKAEMPTRERAEAHGKASATVSESSANVSTGAVFASLASRTVRLTQPVQRPQARSTERLPIQYVSPYVDMVTVLPGQRFPLRVLNAAGQPVPVKWRANGGAMALGDRIAVWTAPLKPGAHRVTGYALSRGKVVQRTLSMIVAVPTGNVKGGKLNGYPIGTYPRGFGQPQVANRGSRDTYEVPTGFIELTAATMDVPVSAHYKLRDFAGKDNFVNGRKYLFLEPRVVEKLEMTIATLHQGGYSANKLELMSAYRSPYLNKAIGNTTSLSRHTYGDAVDMHVSDFNRDGVANKADADILMWAITKLDKETPLTGGASLYAPTGGHGYFIHTDTRGALVRW